jgi:hypothetical protein
MIACGRGTNFLHPRIEKRLLTEHLSIRGRRLSKLVAGKHPLL